MPRTENPIVPNEFQRLKVETFRQRLRKREIWLNGPIDDTLVETLYVNLIEMESKNPNQAIKVVINSPGGYLYESIVAADIMTSVACPVATIALANACSGGFIIFMAGKERLIHENTCLMMHDVSTGVYDKASEITAYLQYLQATKDRMARFLSRQTEGKTTPEFWLDVLNNPKDRWFSAEEAVKLGIAHRIISGSHTTTVEPYMWNVAGLIQGQML